MDNERFGQNDGQERLRELSQLQSDDVDGIEASISSIATKILNKEDFGIESIEVWDILTPYDEDVSIELIDTLEYIQGELARYLMYMRMSGSLEDQRKYRRFFNIDGTERISNIVSERVIASTDILEILKKARIENTEFRKKLFKDIYIEYGFEQLLNSENLNDYVEDLLDLAYYFVETEFFEGEEQEENIKELQYYTYLGIRKLFLENEIPGLIKKNRGIKELLNDVMENGWFLDKEMVENIRYDENLQEALIRLDIAIERQPKTKHLTSPLSIFIKNIDNFSSCVEETRKEKLRDLVKETFLSLDMFIDKEDWQTYQSLFENVNFIEQIYNYKHKETLDRALSDMFNLKVEGVKEEDFLVPFWRAIVLDLMDDIRQKNEENLLDTIDRYIFLKKLMQLYGKEL